MKKILVLISVVAFFIFGGLIVQVISAIQHQTFDLDDAPLNRIISLSPNITEILFELGLEKKIVGVTNYCSYPEAAQKIAKVGGYLDPNFEAIVSLKPDVVIILPEQENVKNFLSDLDVIYLEVNNKTISDIFNGIKIIGAQFGKAKKAEKLVASLQKRIEKIKEKTAQSLQPKVLISVGRTLGSGRIADVFAAGKNTYFDELIKLAGARNVIEMDALAYPLLSAEGIISVNPDIILDFATDYEKYKLTPRQVKEEWNCLSQINAVRFNRIHVLGLSYAVIPGPRFILLLEELARIFHPEINWEEI
jgi:iron complex transport system substrate-binding protein